MYIPHTETHVVYRSDLSAVFFACTGLSDAVKVDI